ncbi:Sphingosine-1-phosphate lyase [Hondaea fermentalgiana]|uniref:sphinganine-1-phosphate aldolase n=1 Tax=Hondaea fermentalgiana TaxID=2315210 RepID=A0A2R5GES8_9STRA|nr:Sphingosine-1-phosphate lyase [Hondaea fermentalgiana]|eukprot:GBG26324.1 Sphingosine-1-phosphate lyase [Hondaea fermentalgiana]
MLRVQKTGKHESLLEKFGEIFANGSYSVRVLGDVVGVYAIVSFVRQLIVLQRTMRSMTLKQAKDAIGNDVADMLKSVPVVKDKIKSEFEKVEKDLELSLKDPARERIITLPEQGIPKEEILGKMRKLYGKEKSKWHDGWVSGAVYHGGDEHIEMQSEVFGLFNITNPLHPDIWPSVMQFEAEIVSMTANLLNGGTDTVTGTMTSGGTESIIMAAKTHREWARKERGITRPEIVACDTAHAAIDKACEMLGIKLVHVPMDETTCAADPKVLESYVTPDTIMIYSSAPQYPHGVIDPIAKLSEIAVRNGCGLHVDCCLGGFVLPFAKKLGYDIPDFDFGLPGVTSMSCDTHKYGYAAKGTSVVLYRSAHLRNYQYFSYPSWLGGVYVTPSTAGSRPGALSACTWASMVAMGEKGFLEATQKIMDAAAKIRKAVEETPGVHVVGKAQAMIVAFASKDFSVYMLVDKLEHRGWSLNSLQRPAAAHICVTLPVVANADQFIKDLRESAAECLRDPNPPNKDEGQGRLYGAASALPSGPIKDVLNTYTNVVLKV